MQEGAEERKLACRVVAWGNCNVSSRQQPLVQESVFIVMPGINSVRLERPDAKAALHGGQSGSIASAVRRLVRSWPTSVRVPLIAGLLIFSLGFGLSWGVTILVSSEQELWLRRLVNTYLDGISTAVFARVSEHDHMATEDVLRRAMWFHQGIRERRLIIRLENGKVFADVTLASEAALDTAPDPIADPAFDERLRQRGLVIEDGAGWAIRSLRHQGQPVADIYVLLDLRRLQERRDRLHFLFLVMTLMASLLTSLLGYLLLRRTMRRVWRLLAGLENLQAGSAAVIPDRELPPPGTEFGHLMRGFNEAVHAVGSRNAMMVQLAEQEASVLAGRLAATVAHEVRNPLGGMSNAVDTIRKFGRDPAVVKSSVNLIERGLRSIGDVVGALLASYRKPAGGRPVGPEDFHDLRLLIEPEARRRRLAVQWNIAVPVPLSISATEVRQIALNLLLNACEASPPDGNIAFRAAHLPDLPGLLIEVTDSGPGVPDSIARVLTDDDAERARSLSGGMGITVVRQLVTRLNGEVHVHAGENSAGATVTVRLHGLPACAMEEHNGKG